MISYIWPIALVIFANVVYQICAKSVPAAMDPMASLTVTYGVALVASFVLYMIMNKGGNIIREYAHLNWAPFAFGLILVCLEVGYIFAYRAGWPVNSATIVQASIVAIALLFVGLILYKEPLSWNKVAGAVICMIGLVFINYK